MPALAQIDPSDLAAAERAAKTRPTVTIRDAAALCGIATTTAYEHARSGDLFPVVRLGTLIRVPSAPLMRLLGVEPGAIDGKAAVALAAARSQPTISVPEFCALYDVGRVLVYNLIKLETIPALRVGSHSRIPSSHVLRELGLEGDA